MLWLITACNRLPWRLTNMYRFRALNILLTIFLQWLFCSCKQDASGLKWSMTEGLFVTIFGSILSSLQQVGYIISTLCLRMTKWSSSVPLSFVKQFCFHCVTHGGYMSTVWNPTISWSFTDYSMFYVINHEAIYFCHL